MCSRTLDAVAVIDSTFPSFRIYIKILKIIIEVDRSGAEITPEECGVGGENGCDINATLLAEREGDSRKPFVEMSDDSLFFLVGDKLWCELA